MDDIRKHLDKVEVLPLSPTLLPKLLPKLSDVDTNFDEVVEIIAFDPALTSKLLHICNSAYFGQETEVHSVAEAVNRVGYQAVYLLVAMINGSGCFPYPSPAGVDSAKLWRHSVLTAFNAKFVAESAGVDGGLLFTAGLLHDLGKIVLGQEQPQAAAELYRQPSDTASVARERDSLAAATPKWARPCWSVGNCRRKLLSLCGIIMSQSWRRVSRPSPLVPRWVISSRTARTVRKYWSVRNSRKPWTCWSCRGTT